MQTRKEFIQGCCAAGIMLIAPVVAAADKKQYSLISISAKCCGTCQHWRGERQLVEQGKRIRCEQHPTVGCMRGPGFKCPPGSSASSHGCISGKFYKRWSSLP